MKDTILIDSHLGKRLNKIRKKEKRCLSYKGNIVPLITQITLGRDTSNNVIIEDPMASRNHAIIQKIKHDFYIRDMHSTNGTYVNETLIPEEKYLKLRKNDIIRIGRTELTIL
jgi:pSer/pThr/pTyr-binding forkhead associated (FHA) protein